MCTLSGVRRKSRTMVVIRHAPPMLYWYACVRSPFKQIIVFADTFIDFRRSQHQEGWSKRHRRPGGQDPLNIPPSLLARAGVTSHWTGGVCGNCISRRIRWTTWPTVVWSAAGKTETLSAAMSSVLSVFFIVDRRATAIKDRSWILSGPLGDVINDVWTDVTGS